MGEGVYPDYWAGPTHQDKCPWKREAERGVTQRTRQCGHRCRDWSDVATGRGAPVAPEDGRGGKNLPKSLQRERSGRHPDFRLPGSRLWKNDLLLLVVIFCSSRRKLLDSECPVSPSASPLTSLSSPSPHPSAHPAIYLGVLCNQTKLQLLGHFPLITSAYLSFPGIQ